MPAVFGCALSLPRPYNPRFPTQDERVLDPKLLNILVCPVSKAPLIYDEAKQELLCKASGLAYPIRDGIPVMLEEEARALTTDEKLD
jgi:uncharacterized protein YbaR (Trm112 family)|tara:strand:- start:33 stop:293 length:261 start_codon:yes stop_codon:yes gene_type:complete